MNIFTCTIHAEHTRNEFYRTLSIQGINFIACWAYWEPISSHAEHARKCLKVEYLGGIEYDFQKSCVTGPRDHKVSVSAKSQKKKFHACVPLNQCRSETLAGGIPFCSFHRSVGTPTLGYHYVGSTVRYLYPTFLVYPKNFRIRFCQWRTESSCNDHIYRKEYLDVNQVGRMPDFSPNQHISNFPSTITDPCLFESEYITMVFLTVFTLRIQICLDPQRFGSPSFGSKN